MIRGTKLAFCGGRAFIWCPTARMGDLPVRSSAFPPTIMVQTLFDHMHELTAKLCCSDLHAAAAEVARRHGEEPSTPPSQEAGIMSTVRQVKTAGELIPGRQLLQQVCHALRHQRWYAGRAASTSSACSWPCGLAQAQVNH